MAANTPSLTCVHPFEVTIRVPYAQQPFSNSKEPNNAAPRVATTLKQQVERIPNEENMSHFFEPKPNSQISIHTPFLLTLKTLEQFLKNETHKI